MTLHAIASAFFEPAQAAIVPGLVPPRDLVLAGALENSLWSVTLAVGSAAGGALLALVGRDAAFVFDGASFVASALLLRRLPAARARRLYALADEGAPEAQPNEGSGPRDMAADLPLPPPEPLEPVGFVNLLGLRDLRDGLRYIATHRRVRAIIIVKSCFGLTLGGVLVLLAYFGERVFQHGGGAGIAALWTARGVGSLVGPLAAFRLVGHDEPALRRGILWSFISLVVCYLGFAASPGLWMAAGFLAVANAGGSTLWTYGSALLQQIVPDEVRGRVSAAEMGGMTLAMSTSTWVVGQLLDVGAGPRPLMAGCALVALVPVAFWLAVQPSFERART
jgi:predicted MFS family arabinose efflux permease